MNGPALSDPVSTQCHSSDSSDGGGTHFTVSALARGSHLPACSFGGTEPSAQSGFTGMPLKVAFEGGRISVAVCACLMLPCHLGWEERCKSG